MTYKNKRRRSKPWRAHVCHGLLLLLFFASVLTPRAAMAEPSEQWHVTVSLEQHIGVFQDDVFASFNFQLHQRLKMPQLGRSLLPSSSPARSTALVTTLQAPLRLRVVDRPPEDEGIWRAQDWDTPRDVWRVLRALNYGEPGSPFQLHAGELNAVQLMNGALVSHFFNAVNPDAPAAGVHITSSMPSQDAALMLDDVTSPGVVGAGVMARPFVIARKDPLIQRLGVGAHIAADLGAPTLLARDERGFVEVDAASAPTVESSTRTFIGGPAFEFWVLARQQVSVLLHAEVFWHDRLGRGEHVGASVQWKPLPQVQMQWKSSAIFAHDRYIPRYISPLYQVERFQIEGLGATLPTTKRKLVEELAPRDDLYLANTLVVEMPAWRSALLVDYLWARDTPDADALTLSLRAQPVDRVALSLFYHQNFFDGLEQSLSFERSLIGSELRVMPWGPLYVVGRYDRRWRLRDDGLWRGVQDWHVGVGVQFAFGVD